ncbi:MAG: hypothetical protein ACM3ST_15055 [Bdellovibrio bacteriovorus]
MQVLIRFYVELCLLRRAPQDLPASSALFWAVLAVDLAVGLAVGLAAGLPLGTSLTQDVLEAALMLGALYAGLYFTRHPARFLQSASALLGTSALISLAALIPMSLNPTGSEETDAAALGAVLLLGLIIWSVVVAGHILRHTFGISLAQGAAIAVSFQILVIGLLGGLSGA